MRWCNVWRIRLSPLKSKKRHPTMDCFMRMDNIKLKLKNQPRPRRIISLYCSGDQVAEKSVKFLDINFD